MTTKRKPTERQVLGAKIQAAREAWFKRVRKPCGGGWNTPTREVERAHLSRKFGLSPRTVQYFFTYSRSCTHPWSKGACPECPGFDTFDLVFTDGRTEPRQRGLVRT